MGEGLHSVYLPFRGYIDVQNDERVLYKYVSITFVMPVTTAGWFESNCVRVGRGVELFQVRKFTSWLVEGRWFYPGAGRSLNTAWMGTRCRLHQ